MSSALSRVHGANDATIVDGITYASPTYLLTSIRDFISSITYRMLADGMLLQDIEAATEGIKGWPHWCDFFMALAHAHEQLAHQSLENGYSLSASEHLVRAALCAHYGQFLYFGFPEIKKQAVELKLRLYQEAAPLMSPSAERIEVPYERSELPAYLRVPPGRGPFPWVVVVGGLDAAKEDMHQFASLCLARGLATVVFDGPGQGEAYARGLYLNPNFHHAVSAVIDRLSSRVELNADRIGIIGRSLGGFLAPQTAALDKRIKACVAWGALYDLGSLDRKPPLIRDGYRFVTGAKDWAEAKELTSWINLAGTAERITCPLYIVHGAKDNSVPPSNAERLAREARGPVKLRMVPNSIHCNHEVAHVVRPDMADWLAAQLR
ncbi:MAG: alpha/beta hydrolase [Burkholderiaceae bacterium]